MITMFALGHVRGLAVAWALVTLSVAVLPSCEERIVEPSSLAPGDAALALAGAWCGFEFSCECDEHEYQYPTEPDCIASEADLYAARLRSGERAGLTFDGECVVAELELAEARACILDPWSNAGATNTRWCSYFHGERRVGQSCTPHGQFDDCDRGLYCNDGRCTDPDPRLATGAACDGTSRCAEGEYCSDDGSDVCTILPSPGEPCTSACALGSVCSTTGTCRTLPERGEACIDGQCAEGLYCDAASSNAAPGCAVRKSAGDPCSDAQQCDSGECSNGACAPGRSWVCG
jgi:hypothetical protein